MTGEASHSDVVRTASVQAPSDVLRSSTSSIGDCSPAECDFSAANTGETREVFQLLRKLRRSTGSLRVLSLNLGGRNTNPLEFELRGDDSHLAQQSMAMLRRAGQALRNPHDGPASMPASEHKLIGEILAEIYQEAPSDAELPRIQRLLTLRGWMLVLSCVKAHQPHLFNALNLPTLKLRRPSVWEDPDSCLEFSTTIDYLVAWQQWYRGLDRTSGFWLEEGPRTAKKRNMDMATCFAGLLVYDVMCLCSARHAIRELTDDSAEDSRKVPFQAISRFAAYLPAARLSVRHRTAEKLIQHAEAHVLFAQEARQFAEQPNIASDFLPPFNASDGFTAVFLRKDAFARANDISQDVTQRMHELIDVEGQEDSQKAWRTTANRLAAVHAKCSPKAGGFEVCLVSLHCSQSEGTATFLETLRDVLAAYPADIYVCGMDSNCPAREVEAFQRRLRSAGFEIGSQPDQVTVVKQRTHFQTQIRKAGEPDISHKDYVVSWGNSPFVASRGETVYAPDLRTAYGVEQQTGQCVRMPTIRWPFDHCSVGTSFYFSCPVKRRICMCRRVICAGIFAFLIFLITLLPLMSGGERESPYGPPGMWHHATFRDVRRAGICETAAPCRVDQLERGWRDFAGSCYGATPAVSHDEADGLCLKWHAQLVTISSEAENDFVTEALCEAGDFCWIGLRGDLSGERQWWASGEPLNFTHLCISNTPLFPLFPQSRDEREQVAVVSAWPREISGCSTVEFLTAMDQVPRGLVLLRLVSFALALLVSAVLLVLPRRLHLGTEAYLVLSLLVNAVRFLSTTNGMCFASEMSDKLLSISAAQLAEGMGASVQAVWALCLVRWRTNLLYPSRVAYMVLLAIVGVLFVMATMIALFLDTTSALDTASAYVLVFIVLSIVVLILLLLFSTLISYHLYQSWSVIDREVRAGCSKEEARSSLSSQARAAQIQFISVIAAFSAGGIRWVALFIFLLGLNAPSDAMWTRYTIALATSADSITNNLCAYLMAALNMNEAAACTKGITAEVAKRASLEVEQHHLAVRLLKAAPTSQEQLQQFADLESKARATDDAFESQAFAVLQSAVYAESQRIHRLMRCVRVRAMTMPLRYQYLIDTPEVHSRPRQHVPRGVFAGEMSDDDYFAWLYAAADEVMPLLFRQVKRIVGSFNSTVSPSDLGLDSEQFPWKIWPEGPPSIATRFHLDDLVVNPGDILHLSAGVPSCCGFQAHADAPLHRTASHCLVLEEASSNVVVHRSGAAAAETVKRSELRSCSGAAVLIPGPKKTRQRCLDKIELDYKHKDQDCPAAASLVDVCRCMILLDDPYAIAVLVAHIKRSMRVVRIKNRFNKDVLAPTCADELQSMFYAAEMSEDYGGYYDSRSGKQEESEYADISINVEMRTAAGHPFICEIQVTLPNLAILKHADTKLYTIRRMQSPQELRMSHVFDEP